MTSVEFLVPGTNTNLNASAECIQSVIHWGVAGAPIPPPDVIKKVTIVQYAVFFSVRSFIETGTFVGTTTKLMADSGFQCKTIELAKEYYDRAVNTFSAHTNVELFHGDSGEWLGKMTASAEAPHLFWLDGHYSGGKTARGSSDTPIVRELDQLLGCDIKNSVILIDDAREFGKGDYPPISFLEDYVKANLPDHKYENFGDIFRITPGFTLLEKFAAGQRPT
jgi:hypothetical protein